MESPELSHRRLLEMAAAIAAGTRSSFGQALAEPGFGLPPDKVTVLRIRSPRAAGSWPEVVAPTLAEPLGIPKLRAHSLKGKRVVVIADDWGRPPPASEVIPLVLEELHTAGAEEIHPAVEMAS